MTKSITIDIAESKKDLEQILELQRRNHIESLTFQEREKNGFVTVKHDLDLLTKMNHSAPQIIAKSGEEVIGYALVMFKSFSELIPVLTPMFDMFKKLAYNDKPLNNYKYYVMGQICIDEAFRGQGLFEKLYQKHKQVYSPGFDVCLTEVSTRNARSMKAHGKVGFQTIYTFKDNTDEWNILLWDWESVRLLNNIK